MADLKISQLSSATTPLSGTEVLPIVQSGSTKKVATDDLTVKNVRSNATTGVLQIAGPGAGTTRVMTTPNANFTVARSDAAQSLTGDQTLSTGNMVQGAAAKGFNFTANTPAAGMTSQLLNWYEQGTWTATLKGGGSDPTTPVTVTGNYTRVGRLVHFHAAFVNVNTTGAAGAITFTGLPFTSANVDNHMVTAGVFQGATFSNNVGAFIGGNSTTIQLKSFVSNAGWSDITHNAGAGAYFWISGVYFV